MAILRGSLVHDLSSTDSLAAGQDVRQEGEKVDYNPLDAGVLVEGGKVIGQNSIRVAGRSWTVSTLRCRTSSQAKSSLGYLRHSYCGTR